MTELKLEVGKTYLDRTGDKETIEHADADGSERFPFVSSRGLTFAISGRFYPDAECQYDLISEVIEPVQATDSTPKVSVGDSSFEDWYQAHEKACTGDKQLARDAYAAGMCDTQVGCSQPVQPSTDKLLQIIAAAYQIAGACDAPAHILDVLANPEKATQEQIESMLPFAITQPVQQVHPTPGRQSFGEKYPRNPDAKCKCEHWEACIDCHPTYNRAAIEQLTKKEVTP